MYLLRASQFHLFFNEAGLAKTPGQKAIFDDVQTLPTLFSLGWDDAAIRYGRRVVNGVINGYYYNTHALFRNCANWFYVKLFADWQRINVENWPEHPFSAPPYDLLLQHWRDESLNPLTDILLAACDWHTHECFGLSDDPKKRQDFDLDPYMGWPIEIHMVYRLRESLGLSLPELDHPLMKTGLAVYGPVAPIVTDELLDEVTAKACQQYPELRECL